MIFASIDIRKKSIEEFLSSLSEARDSGFDGIEICLWDNMLDYSQLIRKRLEEEGLSANVHGDLMRDKEGYEKCRDKFLYSLKFSRAIGANLFISHPIKPYLYTLDLSKRLFHESNGIVTIETVKDIKMPEIRYFGKPFVADIGNIINNNDWSNLRDYSGARWVHIHDYKDGKDHHPLGQGKVDLQYVLDIFQSSGFTIELDNKFRTWERLKEGYRSSIDVLVNAQIRKESYGKNVRLQHLSRLVRNKRFQHVIDFGCGEGYLLHNVNADKKTGYDINPKKSFNDVNYVQCDLRRVNPDNADLLIHCAYDFKKVDWNDIYKTNDSTQTLNNYIFIKSQ